MFNVCTKSGQYRADKRIEQSGIAVCPVCGHRQQYRAMPLFVVTGASGTGKTVSCLALSTMTELLVALECDILLAAGRFDSEEGKLDYRDHCLRVSKNIAQAGRPVVLFGSALPQEYEVCTERRYFSDVHYLALVCDEQTLLNRLNARPGWRRSAGEEFLRAQISFNCRFLEWGSDERPACITMDTTDSTVQGTAQFIMEWISEKLDD